MPAYVDLLRADAALNELGRRMIRSGASVDETAVALLELTGKYYETLSDLSWRGFQIESNGGGDVVAKAADNCAAGV
jgi:hypothetical protein